MGVFTNHLQRQPNMLQRPPVSLTFLHVMNVTVSFQLTFG